MQNLLKAALGKVSGNDSSLSSQVFSKHNIGQGHAFIIGQCIFCSLTGTS